jgi:hypothetical protein
MAEALRRFRQSAQDLDGISIVPFGFVVGSPADGQRRWKKSDFSRIVPANQAASGQASAMSHYIVEGGSYAKAYAKLAASGFQLHWQSAPPPEQQRNSKTKFTCPECSQNAWAKPDAGLICAICFADLKELKLMLAEAR